MTVGADPHIATRVCRLAQESLDRSQRRMLDRVWLAAPAHAAIGPSLLDRDEQGSCPGRHDGPQRSVNQVAISVGPHEFFAVSASEALAGPEPQITCVVVRQASNLIGRKSVSGRIRLID